MKTILITILISLFTITIGYSQTPRFLTEATYHVVNGKVCSWNLADEKVSFIRGNAKYDTGRFVIYRDSEGRGILKQYLDNHDTMYMYHILSADEDNEFMFFSNMKIKDPYLPFERELRISSGFSGSDLTLIFTDEEPGMAGGVTCVVYDIVDYEYPEY